jgi:hypothetical protein
MKSKKNIHGTHGKVSKNIVSCGPAIHTAPTPCPPKRKTGKTSTHATNSDPSICKRKQKMAKKKKKKL